jgi:hypothetical protein
MHRFKHIQRREVQRQDNHQCQHRQERKQQPARFFVIQKQASDKSAGSYQHYRHEIASGVLELIS